MASLIRDRAASTAEMLAVFCDESLVRAALALEAALAEAEAAEGLIPGNAASLIAQVCADLPVDIDSLAAEAAHAGTLAIALLHRLRTRLGEDTAAAKALHLGATSQDVADTALMLQVKAGLDLIERDMGLAARALERLTERHAATPMLGRTLLQPAMPITFGLKTAGWLLALEGARNRLSRERADALVLQLGGGVGALTGLGEKGMAVAERVAKTLGLACPLLPWHARRERIAGLASALAITCGVLGKIARDIALMAQAEVAEAFEPRIPGRGGSSAMPHKHNPTSCQVALSAALRAPGLAATVIGAMPQEHERGLGGWQAEAPVLAELFEIVHGALAAMLPVLDGLTVDAVRMATNLAAAGVGTDTGESVALVRSALDGYRKARSLRPGSG